MKKIAVAMSGGVDSTTCAALLKEQGYEVVGLFMDLGGEDSAVLAGRVRELGERIGVAVEVVDLAVPFRRLVKDYFRQSYLAGLTPNPCVVCNRQIKFGLLLDHARSLGAEHLATGHYVRLALEEGGVRLEKGHDPAKDQSYFLCRLRRSALASILFPLGGYRKEEVYKMAGERGLFFKKSGESQDVCFLAGARLADYLTSEGSGARPGKIVDGEGRVLGSHQGVHLYTIGQRRGLGVPAPHPLFVTGIEPAENLVKVGEDGELWRQRCRVGSLNWLTPSPPESGGEVEVKIRHRHRPAPARLIFDDQGGEVVFSVPQRAVTPGQFAAFYRGDELLGGAEIIG